MVGSRSQAIRSNSLTKIRGTSKRSCSKLYACQPKNRGGKTPQIIHLFIGFGTIIFTIHFAFFPPIFGNTNIQINSELAGLTIGVFLWLLFRALRKSCRVVVPVSLQAELRGKQQTQREERKAGCNNLAEKTVTHDVSAA